MKINTFKANLKKEIKKISLKAPLTRKSGQKKIEYDLRNSKLNEYMYFCRGIKMMIQSTY
ncbi:hypothetical protein BpHYR1_005038 [Brachionus plicatilis]|uniref:Uncharacterized protein n=1 Tax=Brachionus plicatilis TaxID=10195 RepID=A0A3M7RH52_BRAPC|nr:hypothetical protein BpHYR1_005038 [Brachionus plicatilis]